MFQSLPNYQKVPSYPCSTALLKLFTQIGTRAAARAAGVPESMMPEFDPTMPEKWWLDSTAPATGPKKYSALATATEGTSQQIIIPAFERSFSVPASLAGVFNLLPDPVVFSPYVPTPTTAFLADINGNFISPVDPFELCNLEEAEALSEAVSGSSPAPYIEAPGPDGFHIVYPNLANDPRKVYAFLDSESQLQFAGKMLQTEFGLGVGHPGAWQIVNNIWTWVNAIVPPPPVPKFLPYPVPERSLRPGETIQIELAVGPMVFDQASF